MSGVSKSVFIAGASAGIGFSLAKEFAKRGYTVYAGARSVDKMDPLKEYGVKTFQFDITNQQSINKARDYVEEDRGGRTLDILYLNAGIFRCGTLFDTPVEEFQEAFNTNLFGHIMTIQAFHKMLLKSQGTIAFTSSTAIHFPAPFQFPYTVTKTAFDNLAQQVALDAGKLGIKVVNVRTGAVGGTEINWHPSFVPQEDSVYYRGEGVLLGKDLEVDKSNPDDYAKSVVGSVEKAVRKNKMYTVVYAGAGSTITWLVGLLPYWMYYPFIFNITGTAKMFPEVKKKILRQP